jgi:Protein of unknown function (DUF3370)
MPKKALVWTMLLASSMFFAACQQSTAADPNLGGPVSDSLPSDAPNLEPVAVVRSQATISYTASQWRTGALTSSIVSPANLKALGGDLSGATIWKSNNPEVIRGNGWLMQNSRTDASRGGTATPLTGTHPLYLFHINKSGSTKYVHVLVTNPQNSSVTISGKGSMYTNQEKPLGISTGQSYQVARDWLENTLRTSISSTTLGSRQAYQVYRATVPNGGIVDGRFEITSSAGVYYYTVVTSSGTLTDAINASQGGPASGDLASLPAPDKFGREAGIYAASGWSGTTNLDVPAAPAHIGLDFNTTGKNPSGTVILQDQTASASMRLSDSSDRTHGNYAHKYAVTLALSNTSSSARTVRLSIGSNVTGTVDTPSFTYNGPLTLNGTLKNVYLKPTAPKQVLATWTINANSSFNGSITLFVPGLITVNQQLILESI